MNLRDQILSSTDSPSHTLAVPEWGCTVEVRTISGAERESWELSLTTGDTPEARRENVRAKLLVRSLYADGVRIFTDSDAAALGQKSGKVLERLYDVSAKLNGVREGDIDELGKNS